MLSRLATISECDRRTDGRTDIIPISMSRVSIAVLTRDKIHTGWSVRYYARYIFGLPGGTPEGIDIKNAR